MKKFFLWLFLLPLFVRADFDPFSTESDDPALVHHVHVISGHLNLSFQDLTARGALPLPLMRTYSSSGALESAFHQNLLKLMGGSWMTTGGWNILPHAKLIIEPIPGKHDNTAQATLTEPGGSPIAYTYSHREGNYIFLKPEKSAGKGFGRLSARNNAYNNLLRIDCTMGKAVVFLPNGGQRSYHGIPIKNYDFRNRIKFSIYLLDVEILPSKHRIHYVYGKGGLERVEMRNPKGDKLYSSLSFAYTPGNKDHLSYLRTTTSDNDHIRYISKYYQQRESMEEVYSNVKPDHSYQLASQRRNIGPRIVGVNVSEKPCFQIEYYTPPDGRHDRKWDNGSWERPYFVDKVRAIIAPMGPSGERVAVASFGYEKNYTNVIDAEGLFTRYHHSEGKLTAIQYFRNRKVHSTQSFYWQGSRIYCKAMWNSDNRLLFAKTFYYEGDNVVKEVVWGDITGNARAPLSMDTRRKLSGAETYTKTYSYYTEDHNLLKSETEEGGATKEYRYLPGTDLLFSKCTTDAQGNVLLRAFHFYDEDNLLICEIIDDGNTRDPNDLSGATQRLLKKTERNPSSGLPETVSELYFDLTLGREVLLKKSRLTYENNRVVAEAVYDSEDTYRYTIYTEYDRYGGVARKTNPLGQESTYEYNSLGLLIRSKEVGSPEKLYTYDKAGRLTACVETDSDKTTSTSYDVKGRVLSQTDHRGHTVRYSYDSFGNRTAISFPTTVDEKEERYDPMLFFAYNTVGDMVESSNPMGGCTKNSYNLLQKPLHTIQADGTELRHRYLTNGLLAKTIYADGTEERYSYDLLQRMTAKQVYTQSGDLLRSETFAYSAFTLSASTDARGLTTRFFYDGAGRKIREEAEGRITTFTYDALGFVERVDNGCVSQCKKYNPLGLVEEEWEEDASGAIENRMRFIYDAENRKVEAIRTTSVGEARDFFAYKEGRLIRHTDPNGAITQFIYNEAFLNELGQKVLSKTVVDPLGNQTIEIYDVGDRLAVKERRDPSGATVAKEKTLYDRSGNRAKQISYLYRDGKVEREIALLWRYDTMGRLIAQEEPCGKITRFAYDLRGRLSQKTLPSGVTINLLYDGCNRLLEQKSDGAIHHQYLYENGPDPSHIIDPLQGITIQRRYNRFGELVFEDRNGSTTSWEYDAIGRCTSFVLPDSSSIGYLYSGAHLEAVQRKAYNNRVRYEHKYTKFTPNGHVAEEELIFQMRTIKTFHDLLERPCKETSPALVQTIAYGPSGLVTKTKSRLVGEKEYEYDPLNQLTKEGEETYSFDSLGNSTSYEVNELNQVVSTEEYSFTYDANGYPTKKLSPTEEISYLFDPLGRLVEISYHKERKVRYLYDPLSRLFAKESYRYKDDAFLKEETVYFLYDQDKEIGTFDEKGALLQLKVLGLGIKGDIGASIALELGSIVYAPLHDFSGNVIALLSAQGMLVETYKIDAFGKEEHPSPLSPWRFSSKRHDEGLIFFGLRFYDPSLKRWLSPDPLGFADGPNLYAYVHNSPMNRLDLFGLYSEDKDFIRTPLMVPIAEIRFDSGSIMGKLMQEGVATDCMVSMCHWHQLKFSPAEIEAGSFNLFDHTEIDLSNTTIHLATYNHGINVSLSNSVVAGEKIAAKHPGAITIVRCWESKGLWTDLWHTALELFHVETTEVRRERQFLLTCSAWLYKMNPAVFDSSGTLESLGGLWSHTTHSRGALMDRRGIEGMTGAQRDILQTQILITALGPALPIPDRYGLDVNNYYSRHDFITGWLGDPTQLMVAAGAAIGGIPGALIGGVCSHLFFNRSDCTIHFLPSVSNWKERTLGADHGALGETYQGAIDMDNREHNRVYVTKNR